jgi:hypothetical protein
MVKTRIIGRIEPEGRIEIMGSIGIKGTRKTGKAAFFIRRT